MYHKQLDTFDPLANELPTPFFKNIVERARMIVGKRSIQERDYAVLVINWILEEGPQESTHSTSESTEADSNTSKQTSKSNAVQLYALKDHYEDIEKLEDMPNAAWSDFFAILALEHIKRGYFAFQNTQNSSSSYHYDEYQSESSPSYTRSYFEDIIEASEAIAIAETLLDTTIKANLSKKEAKNKKSLQQANIANLRYVKLNEIKKEFIEYWLENSHTKKVKIKAARLFYDDLDEDSKYELSLRKPSTPDIDRDKAISILIFALRKHIKASEITSDANNDTNSEAN